MSPDPGDCLAYKGTGEGRGRPVSDTVIPLSGWGRCCGHRSSRGACRCANMRAKCRPCCVRRAESRWRRPSRFRLPIACRRLRTDATHATPRPCGRSRSSLANPATAAVSPSDDEGSAAPLAWAKTRLPARRHGWVAAWREAKRCVTVRADCRGRSAAVGTRWAAASRLIASGHCQPYGDRSAAHAGDEGDQDDCECHRIPLPNGGAKITLSPRILQ